MRGTGLGDSLKRNDLLNAPVFNRVLGGKFLRQNSLVATFGPSILVNDWIISSKTVVTISLTRIPGINVNGFVFRPLLNM
ncbi:hypothetical protein RCL_jg22667.t1 [Rhizophagus clarus]|uniref:Uncharacterized protein n=1 Tax=Rhizophagus clarus TaxID=94130 RepID=A0A8H3MFD1_9GLOM|nr:hypothetical protein RCL_jg22667.t1 [Rhizophagus clarus]